MICEEYLCVQAVGEKLHINIIITTCFPPPPPRCVVFPSPPLHHPHTGAGGVTSADIEKLRRDMKAEWGRVGFGSASLGDAMFPEGTGE